MRGRSTGNYSRLLPSNCATRHSTARLWRLARWLQVFQHLESGAGLRPAGQSLQEGHRSSQGHTLPLYRVLEFQSFRCRGGLRARPCLSERSGHRAAPRHARRVRTGLHGNRHDLPARPGFPSRWKETQRCFQPMEALAGIAGPAARVHLRGLTAGAAGLGYASADGGIRRPGSGGWTTRLGTSAGAWHAPRCAAALRTSVD